MKTLHLTRGQAFQLADDLKEYLGFKDSSDRDLFQGFKVIFGDHIAEGFQEGEDFSMQPVVNCTIIGDEGGV